MLSGSCNCKQDVRFAGLLTHPSQITQTHYNCPSILAINKSLSMLIYLALFHTLYIHLFSDQRSVPIFFELKQLVSNQDYYSRRSQEPMSDSSSIHSLPLGLRMMDAAVKILREEKDRQYARRQRGRRREYERSPGRGVSGDMDGTWEVWPRGGDREGYRRRERRNRSWWR